MYTLRTFQHGTLHEVQVCALLEEETARIKSAFWHDNDSPTLLGTFVDNCLYGFCLDVGGALTHAIAGQHVLSTQVLQLHLRRVAEPGVHYLAVRPCLLLRQFLLSQACRAEHQHHKGHAKSCSHLCCFSYSQ